MTADTLPTVAGQYEMQMLVYALAVEQILKCPPVELVLCFLRPGLEYHFVWNAAARQRVVELVNRAPAVMAVAAWWELLPPGEAAIIALPQRLRPYASGNFANARRSTSFCRRGGPPLARGRVRGLLGGRLRPRSTAGTHAQGL